MWSNYDTRKGPHNLQKSAFADLSGQSHVARNNDFCSSWSAENKSEKIDDFTGSLLTKNLMLPFANYSVQSFRIDLAFGLMHRILTFHSFCSYRINF